VGRIHSIRYWTEEGPVDEVIGAQPTFFGGLNL
jgi:hypothetical protein